MATTLGIKLEDDVRNRLKALGQKRDRTPHWIMKTAISDYLQREERYEAEKAEDMARYERYQLTGMSIPQEDAEDWLENLAKGKKTSWQK